MISLPRPRIPPQVQARFPRHPARRPPPRPPGAPQMCFGEWPRNVRKNYRNNLNQPRPMHSSAPYRFILCAFAVPSILIGQQSAGPIALPERVAPSTKPPIVGPQLELDPRAPGINTLLREKSPVVAVEAK